MLGSENQAPRGTGNPGSERIGSHGEAGESRVSLAGHLLPASAGPANLLRAGEGRDGSPERASGRRCSGQRSSERPFGPSRLSASPAGSWSPWSGVLVNSAVRLGSPGKFANLAVSASLPRWMNGWYLVELFGLVS